MRVLIENEAGTNRKNTFDEVTLARLRTEEVSASYPYPYGFIIGTRGEDLDAVDCFVLTARKLASGTVIECEPVALLEQIEDGQVDHKVLAVLAGETVALAAVEPKLRHFVTRVFAHVPGKRMDIGRILDRAEAEAYIRQCRIA